MAGFEDNSDDRDNADGAGERAPVRDEREACLGLILDLRSHGIRNSRLLSIIERVPRRLFLNARQHVLAYVDTQLPIECGQSISAPSTVATMLEHLQVNGGSHVLEIGTGSGYQTGLLAHLAGSVVSLERYRTLVDLARQRLATLKVDNVSVELADGLEGWDDAAPYDRIILNGSLRAIPDAIKQQLADGGILVAPIGESGRPQSLVRMERHGDEFTESDVGTVRFVPLVPAIAARL